MISFSDIVGRDAVKNSIINMLDYDKLSHAYILTGPSGSGKKIFAKALANAILCNHSNHGIPCMNCVHCKSAVSDGITELYQLQTEGNTIKVDEVRQILKSMSLRPTQSNKKVYIIFDGEKMTVQAQNSLLKTFEEPPHYGHIIITVNNEDSILPTIMSRASVINIGMNTKEEVVGFLKKRYDDNELIELASDYSEGCIGKALTIISSEKFKQTREFSCEYAEQLINKNEKKCFSLVKEVNKDNLDDFMSVIIKIFKDMVVFKSTQNDIFLINKDKKVMINNGINKYNINTLLNVAFILEDTVNRLKQNASVKSALDGMTVKILEEFIND
ncbi:MAG: AAA family ATPase [Clostridia bacterium]|nr:AAA family ATPase [Clostridia bacterium]